MMRPRHLGAHTMTVAGWAFGVWWVTDLRLAAAGMIVCLTGIAWWVISLCRDEA